MRSIRNTGKIRVWLISLAAFAVMLAGVLGAVAWHYINRPISLRGAVIQQDEDPKKQSPIMDVQIDAGGNVASAPVKSDCSGYFKLTLRPGVKRGHPITIHFRNPDFQPFDWKGVVGDKVFVVRIIPLHHDEEEAKPNQPQAAIPNIFVRYPIETTAS